MNAMLETSNGNCGRITRSRSYTANSSMPRCIMDKDVVIVDTDSSSDEQQSANTLLTSARRQAQLTRHLKSDHIALSDDEEKTCPSAINKKKRRKNDDSDNENRIAPKKMKEKMLKLEKGAQAKCLSKSSRSDKQKKKSDVSIKSKDKKNKKTMDPKQSKLMFQTDWKRVCEETTEIYAPICIVSDEEDEEQSSIIIDKVSSVSPNESLLELSSHQSLSESQTEPKIESLFEPVIEAQSNSADNVWMNKHCPKSAAESVCAQQQACELRRWILNFENFNFQYSDSESSDDETEKELCVLLTGPTGCGKTSLVYAIAYELGYKVFELNCSSRRNGKEVSKLREVTLSQFVSRKDQHQGKEKKQQQINFSSNPEFRKIVDGSKSSTSNKSAAKNSITNYFTKSSSTKDNTKGPTSSSTPVITPDVSSHSSSGLGLSSNCIILIDDADILFEEDAGFWAALRELIDNSRKPVILTATNAADDIFASIKHVKQIQLSQPNNSDIERCLLDIYSAELSNSQQKMAMEDAQQPNLQPLVKRCLLDNNGDVRRSINQFQYEATSILHSQQTRHPSSLPEESTDDYTNHNAVNTSFNQAAYEIWSVCDQLDIQRKTLDRQEASNEPASLYWNDNYTIRELTSSIKSTLQHSQLLKSILNTTELQSSDYLATVHDNCLSSLQQLNGFSETLSSGLARYYLDYLPCLAEICTLEKERLVLYRENTRKSRRFLHYLDQSSNFLSDECKTFLLKYLHKKEE